MIFEYGAMTSKYSIEAENKLTAYAAMIVHFDRSSHLIVIYSPEESREDSWIDFTGKISERLDEIFGGRNSFENYVQSHVPEIKKAFDSIKKLV